MKRRTFLLGSAAACVVPPLSLEAASKPLAMEGAALSIKNLGAVFNESSKRVGTLKLLIPPGLKGDALKILEVDSSAIVSQGDHVLVVNARGDIFFQGESVEVTMSPEGELEVDPEKDSLLFLGDDSGADRSQESR